LKNTLSKQKLNSPVKFLLTIDLQQSELPFYMQVISLTTHKQAKDITVTHPGTNRARRSDTSLIKTTALPPKEHLYGSAWLMHYW